MYLKNANISTLATTQEEVNFSTYRNPKSQHTCQTGNCPASRPTRHTSTKSTDSNQRTTLMEYDSVVFHSTAEETKVPPPSLHVDAVVHHHAMTLHKCINLCGIITTKPSCGCAHPSSMQPPWQEAGIQDSPPFSCTCFISQANNHTCLLFWMSVHHYGCTTTRSGGTKPYFPSTRRPAGQTHRKYPPLVATKIGGNISALVCTHTYSITPKSPRI